MWESGARGNRKCETVTDGVEEKSLTRVGKKVSIRKESTGGSLEK